MVEQQSDIQDSVTFPVTLTPLAIDMVKKAIEEEGLDSQHGLRIAVRGGGCSGLEYAIDFENTTRPGDSVCEQNGLRIYIDMASVEYLKGTTIDFVQGVHGSGFKFDNPNIERTCGCGCDHSCH